jgi:hypothetical protein
MPQFKNRLMMAVGILALLLPACGDKSKNLKLNASVLQIYHAKDLSRSNKLHILYAKKDSFKNVGNNGLYFTYFLDATDNSYTLHGWPTKKPFLGGGIKFDTTDADIVRLEKGDLSNVTFSDRMYLSPPYLDKDAIKFINSNQNNYEYVCFYPNSYRTNAYGELVKYTIHFSNTPPSLLNPSLGDTTYSLQVMSLMLLQNFYELNPSPPKQDF